MGDLQLDTELIHLPDGWIGRVLTRCQGVASHHAEPLELPDVNQWRGWLGELIANPAGMPGYAALKYSKTGEVFRARLPVGDKAIDVICKQSRLRGLRRRIAGMLRPSRARRNFDRALSLLRADINTARPLALIERRLRRGETWLISEYLPDLIDLDHVTLRRLPGVDPNQARGIKDGIVNALIDVLDGLERHGLTHRDLKASNILMRHWDGDGGQASAWLVDLDGLRGGGRRATGRRRQQLARLAASLRGYDSVTRADHCRFLKGYLSRQAVGADAWKQHFRRLAHQAADYAVRAQRRKTHKLDGYTGSG